MLFTSQSTKNGNIAASSISLEHADELATKMDTNNCYNCSHCYNSYNCRDCDNCDNCDNCSNCSNCDNCRNCNNCSDCNGVLQWVNKNNVTAKRLLAVNGIGWPVSISDTHMQIGCQFHSHEFWRTVTDEQISTMQIYALELWDTHKAVLLALCIIKASSII